MNSDIDKAILPWLDEEGQLFECSGQAPSPSKDFNQIIVTPTQIIFRWWKISHRQADVQRLHPGEIKISHHDFLNDERTQTQVDCAFGQHLLDYIIALCEGKIDYIERLPVKVIKKIINYVELQDIGRLTQVNKRFHQLCEDESVWRNMFAQAGTVTDELINLAKVEGWKTLYFSDKLRIQLQLTRSRKRAGLLSAPAAERRKSPRLIADKTQ